MTGKRKSSMRFHPGSREEPEINLIPFIDVLLVVLIFLMLSTTYNRFTEMQLRLPSADTDAQRDYPQQIVISIAVDGRYMVDKEILPERSDVEALTSVLSAASANKTNPVAIINADAGAAYQSVVSAMEAARRAGLTQLTFASQSSGRVKN
ncbi:MAG: biopolymer transporter ExbD [Burkholderiaceae bacterium]|jgi:biopolymer transport protein ExbD|nr:biopolymer transporter ExbD [Burkholderiaceae bacterium]